MRILLRKWKVTLGLATYTVFQPFTCASDSDWDNNWDSKQGKKRTTKIFQLALVRDNRKHLKRHLILGTSELSYLIVIDGVNENEPLLKLEYLSQDPESLLKWRDRKSIESLEEYTSQMEKLKSRAKRHIILIRHGQYETDGKTDSLRCLTELGRKQASATGERLKNLNIPYDLLITSTMRRAMETSNLILDSVRTAHKHDEMLEEGFPYIPKPARSVDAHRESELVGETKFLVGCLIFEVWLTAFSLESI
uniref:Serine/threonine-protein phosphatase PGAM5, mitochondrial n=1 Tax=Romanomermis culicivorax TaxID=13658 RepID=A0A915K9G0_ROMCU